MTSGDYLNQLLEPLTFEILKGIRSSSSPMGSGSLHYLLRGKGLVVSAPTIGRKIRELEHHGILSHASPEGRVLTKRGAEYLLRAERTIELQGYAGALLRTVEQGTRKTLVDNLIVRSAIEAEGAALAAQNATDEMIGSLDSLVALQREAIERGELGVREDVGFHEALALASGNEVLATMVKLLRSETRVNDVTTAIRAKVGGPRVVDHAAIVEALRRRSPSDARVAVRRHIDRLLTDIEKYWDDCFPKEQSTSAKKKLRKNRQIEKTLSRSASL